MLCHLYISHLNIPSHINQRTQEHQRSLERHFPFTPTDAQRNSIYVLSRFLLSSKSKCALLIKGYAGTGKTTLMSSLVSFLKEEGKSSILLAPTGRAAKVLSNYTGQTAFTIHKYIYRRTMDKEGNSRFSLAPNRRKGALFIVDEASMLSDSKGMTGESLLSDLIEHVFSGPGCKLVLLGDDAQLPPVGMSESPALEVEHLIHDYYLTMAQCVLDEVVRQAEGSAILSLATSIRKKIFSGEFDEAKFHYSIGPEVVHISPRDVLEELENSYDNHGKEAVRVICRSNKTANLYNHQIRNQVFQMDDRLCAGELLMVVRNNYLWLGEESRMPFIANGEMCEMLYSKNQRSLYEMNFSTMGLSFIDQEGEGSIECNVMLDVLDEKGPSMSSERMKQLYTDVRTDLSHENGPSELRSKLQKDPWVNALQVKYGYAITCHKAQGGQWPVVFVDRGFMTQEGMDKEYWRWLYTAVTRATEKVYLIGF